MNPKSLVLCPWEKNFGDVGRGHVELDACCLKNLRICSFARLKHLALWEIPNEKYKHVKCKCYSLSSHRVTTQERLVGSDPSDPSDRSTTTVIFFFLFFRILGICSSSFSFLVLSWVGFPFGSRALAKSRHWTATISTASTASTAMSTRKARESGTQAPQCGSKIQTNPNVSQADLSWSWSPFGRDDLAAPLSTLQRPAMPWEFSGWDGDWLSSELVLEGLKSVVRRLHRWIWIAKYGDGKRMGTVWSSQRLGSNHHSIAFIGLALFNIVRQSKSGVKTLQSGCPFVGPWIVLSYDMLSCLQESLGLQAAVTLLFRRLQQRRFTNDKVHQWE